MMIAAAATLREQRYRARKRDGRLFIAIELDVDLLNDVLKLNLLTAAERNDRTRAGAPVLEAVRLPSSWTTFCALPSRHQYLPVILR